MVQPESNSKNEQASKSDREASELLEWVWAEQGAEREVLFHTSEQEAFATIEHDGARQTWPVRSRVFRAYILRCFYERKKRAPKSETLQRALLTLEASALFDGPQLTVHTRIAPGPDGAVYLDLGDEEWRAVRVDAAGWSVVSRPPVRFRRAAGMKALPVPEGGGSLDELRAFVNVGSQEDFALLVGWQLSAFRPFGPYPVLVLQGEQGAAKSTTSRVQRRLLDPNKAELRAQPREPRDFAISANNAWCMVFDNLSGVPDWLSDSLCRLSTGGGFATRALYTDGEEYLLDAQRPIILNGIDSIATRGDLLDRAIILTLPRLEHIREEADFWCDFDQARPRLLGSLLDAVSTALRREREVRVGVSVRMADAARWVAAAEEALPWKEGEFLRAYASNRADANELALEASPVAAEVQQLVTTCGKWEGTAAELLRALEVQATERTVHLRSWPRTPRGLSSAIRRLAPNLRRAGVEVEFPPRQGHDRRRLIVLGKAAKQPSSSASPSADRETGEFPNTYDNGGADGSADGADASADGPKGADAHEQSNRPHVTQRNSNGKDDADGADGRIPTSEDSRAPDLFVADEDAGLLDPSLDEANTDLSDGEVF